MEIKNLIDKFNFNNLDSLPLECDGLSRVISHILKKNNITHQTLIGSITIKNEKFCPHYWIKINNIIIDYRLKLWFGNHPNIPHGIFYLKNYKNIKYNGIQTDISINDTIFKFLCQK